MIDYISTEDVIRDELRVLRNNEIKYDYKKCGSKNYAVVSLTNGNKLMVDPYRRKVTYKNKTYNYKFLPRWISRNQLKVKL